MAASILQQASAYAASSPLTATWPAAPTSGDVLLALVDSDTTMTSGPTGYAAVTSNVGGQGAYIYEKTAGAGESTALTVTPNGANITALLGLEITGTTGRDAISTVTSAQGSSQSSVNITSITTAAGDGDLVIALVMLHNANPSPAFGDPPTWSNGFAHFTTVGNTTGTVLRDVIYIGTKTVAASTSVGATTCTWPGGAVPEVDSSTWMVGYKAAAAAAGSNPPAIRAITRVPRIRAAHF